MTTRTKDEWQAIMDAKAASPLFTVYLCRKHNIPIQTFYYQRQAFFLEYAVTTHTSVTVMCRPQYSLIFHYEAISKAGTQVVIYWLT
jgi:hypothetical protein